MDAAPSTTPDWPACGQAAKKGNPMGFSKLKKTAAESTTTTVSEPPQVAAPAKEAAPAQDVSTAVSVPESKGLSSLAFKASQVLDLVTSNAESDGGGIRDLFPTLTITGGNAGGNMVPSKGTEKDIADQLPQGKMPVKGIYMAHRLTVVSWPSDFDHRQEDDKPLIICSIPPDDAEFGMAALKAASNFQYCQDKTKWLAANNGPGYLRVSMQIMVYLPQFDDIVILQTAPLLKTVERETQELLAFREPDGSIKNLPLVFQVCTEPWYEKNVFHFWKIGLWADCGDARELYSKFIEAAKDNRQELVDSVMDWFSGQDMAPTDEHRRLVALGASMVNQRR